MYIKYIFQFLSCVFIKNFYNTCFKFTLLIKSETKYPL